MPEVTGATPPTALPEAVTRHVQSVDGTRLAVAVLGREGAPTVVLVHGLGLSMCSWGRVPALLAEEHRIVAYDLRGHGESADARSGDYELGAHASDLAAVLAATLAEGQRAVVVGHSLGGVIILAHAAHARDHRVAGAVFAGSGGSAITLPGLPPARGVRWARRPLRAAWLAALRAVARAGRHIRGWERLADALVRRAAFEPDPPPDAVRLVREEFLSSRPRALAQTTRASGAHDGVKLAPALDVPVLVLHGEHDPQVSQEDVERLLHVLPDSKLVQLPGAGHMLPLTRPELTAQHIRAWVSRTSTADRL